MMWLRTRCTSVCPIVEKMRDFEKANILKHMPCRVETVSQTTRTLNHSYCNSQQDGTTSHNASPDIGRCVVEQKPNAPTCMKSSTDPSAKLDRFERT